MSICIALGTILSRSIHALDIKKKWETKQQQKREEQQRVSEQSHGSASFQPSIQSGREYQHLGGHEHPREALRDSDHGHTYHHDGRNNSSTPVVLSPSQTFDWLDTEAVDPSEDTPPMYDHNASRLPPYDHGSLPRRGRRQREGSPGEVSVVRNGAQISVPRARACTGMRISHPSLNVNQGGAVIWYDALEDRYEVISRSLAPPTEPPLPPPYLPNSCVESLFT